jgi:hypothetical protein
MFSRQKDNYSYLLKVSFNGKIITWKLNNRTDLGKVLLEIFTYHNLLHSCLIKLEIMHCNNWELKCPYHIIKVLRSNSAKNSYLRSKLRRYFYTFKPVPGPWGFLPKINDYDKSKYISPQDYEDLIYKNKKKKKKKCLSTH